MTTYSIKRIYAAVSMAQEAALAMQKNEGNRELNRKKISRGMVYVNKALKDPSIKQAHDECRMNMNALAWANGYSSDSIKSPYIQNLIGIDGMMFMANRIVDTRMFGDPTLPLLLTEMKTSIETIFKHEEEYKALCSK